MVAHGPHLPDVRPPHTSPLTSPLSAVPHHLKLVGFGTTCRFFSPYICFPEAYSPWPFPSLNVASVASFRTGSVGVFVKISAFAL